MIPTATVALLDARPRAHGFPFTVPEATRGTTGCGCVHGRIGPYAKVPVSPAVQA
jgi:hypothetical protein